MLQKLRKTLGVSCYIIQVNSSISKGVPDLWTPYLDQVNIVQAAKQTPMTPQSSPRFQQPQLTPASPQPASPSSQRPASPSSARTSLSSPPTMSTTSNLNLFGSRVMGDWRDQFEETGNEWGRVLHGSASSHSFDTPGTSGPRGDQLSPVDVQSSMLFVRDMTTQALIPWMERTIAHLNEQVASARRGWGGRLVGFGRKYFSATPTPPVTTGTVGLMVHPIGSADYQIRRLCDLLFQMREYKLALVTYDTLKRDFSAQTNTARYYAGVQEMIGITHVLGDLPAPNSRTGHLEASLTAYRDTASVSLHQQYPWGLRAGLLLHEAYKSRGNGSGSSLVLTRLLSNAYIGGDDWSVLRNAMLLEQIAHAHLSVKSHGVRNGMRRKFSFYSMLAGWMFAKFGMHGHGLHLMKQALPLYQSAVFPLIEEQLDSMVALSAYSVKDIDASLRHLERLLSLVNPRGAMSEQNEWVRALLHVWRTSDQRAMDLNVPAMPSEWVSVSLVPPMRESSSPQGTAVEWNDEGDAVWDELERELIDGFHQRGARVAAHGVKTMCAVGEPVYVHFGFQNQLSVPVLLTNIRVECELDGDAGTVVGEVGSVQARLTGEKVSKVSFSKFDIEQVSELSVEGGLTKRTHLIITPKTTGTLHIHRISYNLFDTIPISRGIDEMVVTVTHPMPALQVELHVPLSLLAGQVVETTLEIRNVGNRAAKQVLLVTTHPHVFGFAGNAHNGLAVDSLVELEFGSILPGGVERLRVFVRGEKVGREVWRVLFGYTGEERTSFRAVQTEVCVDVLPSLRISAFTRPSARSLSEFVVGLEVENATEHAISISALESTSLAWGLERTHAQTLPALGAVCMYAKIAKRAEGVYDAERFTADALDAWMIDGKLPSRVPRLALVEAAGKWDALAMRVRRHWRVANLQAAFPMIPVAVIRRIFTNYVTDDLDVSVYWKIGNVEGVHYVSGVNLGVQTSLLDPGRGGGGNFLFEQTKRDQAALIVALKRKDVSPIRVLLCSPDSAELNRDGLCVVDVVLRIKNASWTGSVKWTLELLADAEWTWIGATSHVGETEAKQEVKVCVRACFGRAGVYNINRWKITSDVTQSPTAPHHVTIREAQE